MGDEAWLGGTLPSSPTAYLAPVHPLVCCPGLASLLQARVDALVEGRCLLKPLYLLGSSTYMVVPHPRALVLENWRLTVCYCHNPLRAAVTGYFKLGTSWTLLVVLCESLVASTSEGRGFSPGEVGWLRNGLEVKNKHKTQSFTARNRTSRAGHKGAASN